MDLNLDKSGKLLLWALSLSVIAVIIATGYKFLILKDFNFFVEASCDQSTETCYYRDCEVEECPPNELENYKVFVVSASDFGACSDNSCLNECSSGSISCEEVLCNESEGYICSYPEEDIESILIEQEITENVNTIK